MKEVKGSEKTNIPSKPSRERVSSHVTHSAFNMADAGRREIAYALQLHWSSPTPPPSYVTENKEPIVKGNNNNEIDVSMSSDAQYCYYLLEAMPLPGPTWSTTEPCVLPEPTPSSQHIEASSYTWWPEFLEGNFDGNMTTHEKLDLPFVENFVMGNSKEFSYESAFVDAIDLSCCSDDWLMIPTMEKDLGDMVMH